MNSWITPNDLFYVRNHLPYPNITPDTWTLTVDGEVNQPLRLCYEDLLSLPQISKIVTIECAGNKTRNAAGSSAGTRSGILEPSPLQNGPECRWWRC